MKKTILVPIDYSDVTDALLEEARRLAKALNATLHLVHSAMMQPVIYSPCSAGMGTSCPLTSREQMMRDAADRLAAAAETCRADVPAVTTSLVEDIPSHGVMAEARRIEPIMIVMGSHGHGALHHLLAGSVCEYVMKHAACPIVIVPSRVRICDLDVASDRAVTTA